MNANMDVVCLFFVFHFDALSTFVYTFNSTQSYLLLVFSFIFFMGWWWSRFIVWVEVDVCVCGCTYDFPIKNYFIEGLLEYWVDFVYTYVEAYSATHTKMDAHVPLKASTGELV